MINRMAKRSLISKRNNGNDRRSAEVLLAPAGKSVLLALVAGLRQGYTACWRIGSAEDRVARFMRCMKLVAEPEPADPGDG